MNCPASLSAANLTIKSTARPSPVLRVTYVLPAAMYSEIRGAKTRVTWAEQSRKLVRTPSGR